MIVPLAASIQLPCGCHHTLKHERGDRLVPCMLHEVENVVTVQPARMLDVKMTMRKMEREE